MYLGSGGFLVGLVLGVLVSVLKTVDCFVESLLTFLVGTTRRALVGMLVIRLLLITWPANHYSF